MKFPPFEKKTLVSPHVFPTVFLLAKHERTTAVTFIADINRTGLLEYTYLTLKSCDNNYYT